MSRTDKILRLVAVGFSATELSRQSNVVLDATYESAIPLMKQKEAEIRRVLSREGKHSLRKRQQVTERQHNQEVERRWLQEWKPLPPIKTVNTDIQEVLRLIEENRSAHERNKELFRKTGLNRYAEEAERCLRAMRTFQGHLVHLTEAR